MLLPVALLAACGGATDDAGSGTPGEPAEAAAAAVEDASDAEVAPGEVVVPLMPYADGCRSSSLQAQATLKHLYRRYVLSRRVNLSYVPREARSFGPWEAPDDFDAVEADPAGRITRWDEAYFVTHDWSTYGQQILTMLPGDQVGINGQTVVVEDIFDYPKDAYQSEVLELAGTGAVVLQTCEPESDLNRIVWGRVAEGL